MLITDLIITIHIAYQCTCRCFTKCCFAEALKQLE